MVSPSGDDRDQAPKGGAAGDALFGEVRASLATLSGLLQHASDLGEPTATGIRDALREVKEKIDRKELRVVVVGEVQAGKSTFLDALLGERLLGLSTTRPGTVASIRRAADYGYRVRLANAAIEVFGTRVPDRSAALVKEMDDAQAAGNEAQHRCYVAAADVASASDSVERAEKLQNAAFHALEEARDEAARLNGELAQKEHELDGSGKDAVRNAAKVPLVLRQAPPWWAVWLWIARVFLLVFARRDWAAYRQSTVELEDRTKEVAKIRDKASRWAETCRKAENALDSASRPVEDARAAFAAAKKVLDDTEALRGEHARKAYQLRLELDRVRSSRFLRFLTEVRALCDPESRGSEVAELEVDYPARFLPDDILLIDTPGIDGGGTNAAFAKRLIDERADVCMIVSELERGVSGATKAFLEQLREKVPHTILVLAKMDETLAEAGRRGAADPWKQVEQARRIGTRRFAREVGRDPATVLSVVVAAEEALREGDQMGPASRRFKADVDKLFVLLRQERALILGAWSAGIVLKCIGDVGEAEKQATRAYQARIAALESNRSPEPDQFLSEQMKTIEAIISDRTKGVLAAALRVLVEASGLARVACQQQIAAAPTKQDLVTIAPQLGATILEKLAQGCEQIEMELEEQTLRAARDIEKSGFQSLRERYQLLHEVTATTAAPVRLGAKLTRPGPAPDLATSFQQKVRSFDQLRVGFGVGGAAAGAAAGTLILPGIGSAAGAIVGALASFAKTMGSFKRDCGTETDACVDRFSHQLSEEIAALEPKIAGTIRSAVAAALSRAIDRFARWIVEPLEAERAAIQKERDKLQDLEAQRGRLVQHDKQLGALIKAAAQVSIDLGG